MYTYYFKLLLISIYFTLVFIPSEVLAEDWTTSELTRFGVEFRHPSSFKRLKAAWEEPGFQGSIAAGNSATISDGMMSVELDYGTNNLNEMWSEELQKNGSYISYKVKKNDWYVVSGVGRDKMVFYRKVWQLSNDDPWCFSVNILYPFSMSSRYDRILERMLKGYRPVITEC